MARLWSFMVLALLLATAEAAPDTNCVKPEGPSDVEDYTSLMQLSQSTQMHLRQQHGHGKHDDDENAKDMQSSEEEEQQGVLRCEPMDGTQADILAKIKPCGTYAKKCGLPVAEANKVYPGQSLGKIHEGKNYVVQFDVGLNPNVKDISMDTSLAAADGEKCLEGIITGSAHWGNLGIEALEKKSSYDCMGKCGIGCDGSASAGAYACMKHNLCSAYKTAKTGELTEGFCNDPDCGDEAAQTLFSCWNGFRPHGDSTNLEDTPFAKGVICTGNGTVKGRWHSDKDEHSAGKCKAFEGWGKGQGIPEYKETAGMYLLETSGEQVPASSTGAPAITTAAPAGTTAAPTGAVATPTAAPVGAAGVSTTVAPIGTTIALGGGTTTVGSVGASTTVTVPGTNTTANGTAANGTVNGSGVMSTSDLKGFQDIPVPPGDVIVSHN